MVTQLVPLVLQAGDTTQYRRQSGLQGLPGTLFPHADKEAQVHATKDPAMEADQMTGTGIQGAQK